MHDIQVFPGMLIDVCVAGWAEEDDAPPGAASRGSPLLVVIDGLRWTKLALALRVGRAKAPAAAESMRGCWHRYQICCQQVRSVWDIVIDICQPGSVGLELQRRRRFRLGLRSRGRHVCMCHRADDVPALGWFQTDRTPYKQ